VNVLILGGGEFAGHLERVLILHGHTVDVIERREMTLTDFRNVLDAVERLLPDFVVCTAGHSDMIVGTSPSEVLHRNLLAPINVATACAAFGIPTLLMASTAGMIPSRHHPWYGPAKAGVIAHVQSMALRGHKIWALSPNRMDTAMRENDWPGEDRATRLDPRDVAAVALDIIDGHYPSGANVVVRKVGTTGRVDVFQAPTLTYEGML
jgi:NAD(P)-dependent dehydrogenase (short-subunit alcohol dehydrogenase family)